MRTLNSTEMAAVAGGEGVCTPNDEFQVSGVSGSAGFGDFVINIYEGAVAATSHVIERVANAL